MKLMQTVAVHFLKKKFPKSRKSYIFKPLHVSKENKDFSGIDEQST